MHWMDSLEKHRSILISGMVILGIAMLGLTAMRNTSSFDVFWHLRMGSSWIEDGLVPWIDHFSFTYQGQEVVGPPFMFQAGLALAQPPPTPLFQSPPDPPAFLDPRPPAQQQQQQQQQQQRFQPLMNSAAMQM